MSKNYDVRLHENILDQIDDHAPREPLQDRIAKAMELKRAELINQPLARIWPELALVAIQETRVPNAETVAVLVEAEAGGGTAAYSLDAMLEEMTEANRHPEL